MKSLIGEVFNLSGDIILGKREHSSRRLIKAAEENQTTLIKKLLRDGAYINKQNKEGDTPLMMAARYGAVESVELLLACGANIHQKNNRGETALHAAIFSYYAGSPGITKQLLERGASVDTPSTSGQTPLMAAMSKGDAKTAALLISRTTDVDKKDKWGNSALMTAVRYGNVETVVRLLDKGADCTQKTKTGENLVDVAAKNRRPEVVKVLEDAIKTHERIAAARKAAEEAEKLRQQQDTSAANRNTLLDKFKKRPKPKLGPGT